MYEGFEIVIKSMVPDHMLAIYNDQIKGLARKTSLKSYGLRSVSGKDF